MKKYVEINLKDFNLTLPLTNVINDTLTDSHKEAILNEINIRLKDASTFKRMVKINKKTILPTDYIPKSELKPGRIVRTHTNEIGIITSIVNRNPYDETPSISVVLQGHRNMYFKEHQLSRVNATFEEARCVRFDFSREEDLWHIGDTGYFTYEDIVYKVIIGNTARGFTDLHPVHNGSEGRSNKTWRIPVYSLPLHIKKFLTDEEKINMCH